jgi:hypothetical protein
MTPEQRAALREAASKATLPIGGWSQARKERLFWKLVAVGTAQECWEWQGSLDRDGYGVVRRDGRYTRAHRLSLALSGRDPAGAVVMHQCDNRRCCNPSHLRIGTHAENVQDMISKGRVRVLRGQPLGYAKQLSERTHCRAGHPYSGDNVRRTPKGARQCIECNRAYQRAKYQARVALGDGA